MSDSPGEPSLLTEVFAGIFALFTAIGGFISAQVWSDSKRMAALEREVQALRESVKQNRVDELRFRVDLTTRLHRLETSLNGHPNGKRRG